MNGAERWPVISNLTSHRRDLRGGYEIRMNGDTVFVVAMCVTPDTQVRAVDYFNTLADSGWKIEGDFIGRCE